MSEPEAIVPPGGVVGILGGGQLGRMLALAAARLSLRAHIYAPPGDAPAVEIAGTATRGSEDYQRNLGDFARACDVVTLEFENIPLSAVDLAARFTPVRPGRRALEVSQDRVLEKTFLTEIGAPVVAFRAIDGLIDLREGLAEMGGGFVKTRRLGYDGKGQARVILDSPDQAEGAAREAYAAIGRAPAILEAAAPFRRELSVIVARGLDGRSRCYDPAENVHRDGILRTSTVPGGIGADAAARAQRIAERIVDALDYVGVMGVEFFELPDGALLVNEIAPRVHNSGHWTLEACAVSQFEQHIRAVCGWPLADPRRHADAVMTNLVGEDAADWRALAERDDLAIHLYGKKAIRPGRKMGHVTRLL